MSLPTFPIIDPPLTREGSLNEIISSIAAEELSLSHILNAEGEKLQYVLGTLPGLETAAALDEVMQVNQSVQETLSNVMEQQMLLTGKLTTAMSAPILPGPTGPTGATGAFLIGKHNKPQKISKYDNKIYHITWNTALWRLWAVLSYIMLNEVYMVSSGRMQHQTAFSLFLYPKRRKDGQEMSASNTKQQHTPVIRHFQGEAVVYIPLSELHPFPNQPFKVREDSAMQETVESVRAYGVLTPAIVRPRESGGYEIVSGHRRKHASELAGADALPAIVREMDDDTAIILLVDSNIQREEILPSERAWAFKMKLDAIKRQGARTDLTSAQVGQKLKWSVERIAEQAGESKTQVQRYVRLTELSPSLLLKVDEGALALTAAVELSYLMPDEQLRVDEAIAREQAVPSISQAQRMRKLSEAGELNENTIHSVMRGEKSRIAEPINPAALPEADTPPPIEAGSPPSATPPSVPYHLGDKQYSTFAESIADLKNNDKDCSCTPDQFLAEFTGFVNKFHKEINWFHLDYYEIVFPALSPAQLDYLRQQMDAIRTAVDKLYEHVKGT